MMQLFLQRCTQQGFFGVSYDATLPAMVAEVELDPTSATVVRNVARKSCIVCPGPKYTVSKNQARFTDTTSK